MRSSFPALGFFIAVAGGCSLFSLPDSFGFFFFSLLSSLFPSPVPASIPILSLPRPLPVFLLFPLFSVLPPSFPHLNFNLSPPPHPRVLPTPFPESALHAAPSLGVEIGGFQEEPCSL